MGIFSRFADIVNANINALLDKAEDPEKMVRLIIQEMEGTLIEVRSTFARALANKKEIARKITAIERQVEDWQQKASLALQKNREDLARAALIEKQRVTEVLLSLQQEFSLVEESIGKLAEEVHTLEKKLTETKARQQALILRNETVNKRLRARKYIEDYRTEEAMARFEKFEQRITQFEAEADSYTLSRKQDLQDEFAKLKAEDDISKEIERMKAELANNNK